MYDESTAREWLTEQINSFSRSTTTWSAGESEAMEQTRSKVK